MKRQILCFASLLLVLTLLFCACKREPAPDIGLDVDGQDIPVSPTESGDKEQEDDEIDKIIESDTSDPDPTQDPTPVPTTDDDPTQQVEPEEPQVWKVLFCDRMGNLIVSLEVENGQDAVPPEIPFDEDYRFVSWDKETTRVTSNRIINAICEKRPENDPARLRYSEPDEDGNCALIGIGSYSSATLELPTLSPSGAPVTSVAEGAFRDNKTITTLVLPKGSPDLEEGAFAGCIGLSELVIHGFPKNVAASAFRNCASIVSLVFGDEVPFLEKEYAGWLQDFCYSVFSVTLGKSLEYIEDDFFRSFYKLVDLHNRSQLEIEEGSTENGCIGLYLLDDPDYTDHIILQDGAFFFYFDESYDLYYLLGSVAPEVLADYTDEDDLPDDGTLLLPQGCGEKRYDYYVHAYAFYGRSDIQDLVIPADAVRIDSYAFADCKNMQSITFDQMPRYGIEKYAFKDATALRLKVGETRYIYRWINPEEDGYWHYSYGVPTIWKPGDDNDEELIDPLFDDEPLIPLNDVTPETE